MDKEQILVSAERAALSAMAAVKQHAEHLNHKITDHLKANQGHYNDTFEQIKELTKDLAEARSLNDDLISQINGRGSSKQETIDGTTPYWTKDVEDVNSGLYNLPLRTKDDLSPQINEHASSKQDATYSTPAQDIENMDDADSGYHDLAPRTEDDLGSQINGFTSPKQDATPLTSPIKAKHPKEPSAAREEYSRLLAVKQEECESLGKRLREQEAVAREKFSRLLASKQGLESRMQEAEIAAGEKLAAKQKECHDLESRMQEQSSTIEHLQSTAAASEELWITQLTTMEITSRDQQIELLKLKGRMRILARFRPDDSGEQYLPELKIERVTPAGPCKISFKDQHNQMQSYDVHNAWGPAESDDGMDREMATYIDSTMFGCKACLMFYGQTRTGKTYTMKKALRSIFNRYFFDSGSKPDTDANWQITISAVEVIRQDILDLTVDGGEKLRLVHSGAARGVQGKNWVTLSEYSAAEQQIEQILAQRKSNATSFNTQSSRSHAIFWIKVTTTYSGGELCLVDLAGSEKVHVELDHFDQHTPFTPMTAQDKLEAEQSQARAEVVAKESKDINNGLVLFRKLLRDLCEKDKHSNAVPSFREHVVSRKGTRLRLC